MTTLFAFFHHVLAFTVVGALAIEFIFDWAGIFRLPRRKRLVIADALLGAAAGLLFVVGLARVFFFEKGADYYFHSHAFLTKFSVYIAVALLSIIPTVEFLSWRKAAESQEQFAGRSGLEKLRVIKTLLHGELAAIVIIVLCAAIMARGGWV